MEGSSISKIKCPYCGTEFEFTKYDFINSDNDRYLIDDCL